MGQELFVSVLQKIKDLGLWHYQQFNTSKSKKVMYNLQTYQYLQLECRFCRAKKTYPWLETCFHKYYRCPFEVYSPIICAYLHNVA